MAEKKKLFENKFATFSVIGAVIVFAVMAFVIMSVTATTKAVVLVDDATAGTTITDAMVTEIDVPRDTPGDYYKTTASIVGERLTSNIKKDQLIYASDLMSSIDVSTDTNEDYVTTSINVPDEQALGGVLTAGDMVDISVVPDDGNVSLLAKALPGYNFDTSLNGGVYFILANVKILDSTTSVSSSNGSNMSAATGTSSDDSSTSSSDSTSSYYMVSLSYSDYKKLRIAEQYGKLFLSLVPSQNQENAPLLEQMTASVSEGLVDASTDGTDTTSTSTTTGATTSKTNATSGTSTTSTTTDTGTSTTDTNK